MKYIYSHFKHLFLLGVAHEDDNLTSSKKHKHEKEGMDKSGMYVLYVCMYVCTYFSCQYYFKYVSTYLPVHKLHMYVPMHVCTYAGMYVAT